jgi:hypothetical protein
MKENCMQSLGRKPEGRRPLIRPMHRWEDNIKMNFQETASKAVDWNNLLLYTSWWDGGRGGVGNAVRKAECEDLTMVVMNNSISLDTTACSPLKVY